MYHRTMGCGMAVWLAVCAGSVGAAERPVAEVVVTASPIIDGQLVDRYAAGSTVVSREQIEDLAAPDLASALRRTPGVTISRYNRIGSHGGAEGGAVFIRGMGASRPGAEIKTFVDGVPMYMGVWNHPLLDLLSVDTADTVVVHKGPQPAQFGNAFAAINLVPKKQIQEGFRTDLHVAAGSYDTFVQSAEHAGKHGALDYYLGQSYRSSDGHRERSDGELQNYFGRVGWRLNEQWQASVFGLHTDNYAWDPGVEGGDPVERRGQYGTEAVLGAISLEHTHDDRARGRLTTYMNQGKGRQLQRPDGQPDATWEFEYWGVRVREEWRVTPETELLLGLDYDVIQGQGGSRQASFAPATYRIASPYAAVSHLIGDEQAVYLIPSAGSRYYEHNRYDAEVAPHAGLIAGYRNTQVYFNYARGVLYPGVDARILSEFVMPLLGDSWRDLDAETLDHYELGVSHGGDRYHADLTLFRDEGANRYLIVPPPPPPPVFDNIGDYRIQGVEASLLVSPLDNLSLFAGATFLDSDPGDLPYAPETTLTAGMNWRLTRKIQISLDGQYVGGMRTGPRARNTTGRNPEHVDSYVLLNGKLSYRWSMPSWNLDGEWFVTGENLTDADYEYQPGYPMPGATYLVGIRASL